MRIPLLPLAAALIVAVPAQAQIPPGGPEIVVSAAGGGPPAVALEADGGFVVVWPSGADVLARRFDGAGIPRGNAFVVNQAPATAVPPVVAAHPGGGFLVAWPGAGIKGRRFDAAGVPAGGETSLASDGTAPRVSAGPTGYALAYTSGDNVMARAFDPQLAPRTPPVVVAEGRSADVALRSDGVFVVSFYGTVFTTPAVRVRFVSAAGVPIGSIVTVTTAGSPIFVNAPRIAMGASGAFAVSYHTWYWFSGGGFAPMPTWTADFGTYIQRYDGAGAPLGGPARANVYGPGWQENGAIAVSPAGDIVSAWESAPRFEGCYGAPDCWPPDPPPAPQDGSGIGVYGRVFNAAGADVGGGEFRVNVATTGDQTYPSVAAGSRIHVVAYQSNGPILARVFRESVDPAALEVDPTDEPASDGNRVFENGETVLVAPAWRNVTGAAQTLASTAMGFGGAAGPAYTIADASADFGLIPDGVTRSCRDTGDCFSLGVSGTRPATHWDTYFTEYASPGHLFAPRARTLHIGESFIDVPRASPFYRFVETVFHHTVITRCGPTSFCPASPVVRDAMAFHVVRAASPALVPPNCIAGAERFPDVPASNGYCPYVEELARRGVVGGCGGGLYCPAQGVSRETMAVYLLLTKQGTGYAPPACTTPMFTDVPASSPFCRWIEELARRGIVGGCGGGAYCPTAIVSREQMAVFLTGTFGLLLYGP